MRAHGQSRLWLRHLSGCLPMEPPGSGLRAYAISAENPAVGGSRQNRVRRRPERFAISPSIEIALVVRRGGLSRIVSRQSSETHEVARTGAQRLYRGGKLETRGWRREPHPHLRMPKKAGRLRRFRRCGICPMGALAHPMSARGSRWSNKLRTLRAQQSLSAGVEGLITILVVLGV